MKIKILGTRGEIEQSAPYYSKKSGILLDDQILLDIGDKDFLNYNPKCILITHLHPDHAYFVRNNIKLNINVPIYAPETFGNLKINITNKPFKIKDCEIIPIPTIHSIKVKSNAYLIIKNNQRLLYTGDMIWIEKKYHHLFKNLDLVITEASYKRKNGMIRREKKTEKFTGTQEYLI